MNLLAFFRKSARRAFWVLPLCALYPLSGSASECSGWWARLLRYHAIAPHSSLVTFGQAEKGELPRRLRLLLWNVHKHKHVGWERDFAALEQNADLLLFQEITAGKDGAAIAMSKGKEWAAARSYQTKKFVTGVATGSRARAREHRAVRSPGQEPVLRTPKSALVSKFAIADSAQKLLVINVHAINFTRLEKFRAQLRALEPYLLSHHGPIIVGGDMNTWSRGRIEYLRAVLADHGLREAAPRGNTGMLNLDRVFVRGMKVRKGEVLSHVTSSDHSPLYFEFDVGD